MDEKSNLPPLFLTGRQLAGRLGLSVGQVRALASSGRIPEIVIGRNTRRYDLDAVISALTKTVVNHGNFSTNQNEKENTNDK